MTTRPLIAAAVAAVAAAAVAGTASAAGLTISSHPTLANIVVAVPTCDDPSPSSVPITWTPARDCATTTEAPSLVTSEPANDPASAPSSPADADDPHTSQPEENQPESGTSESQRSEDEPPRAELVQPSDSDLPPATSEVSTDD